MSSLSSKKASSDSSALASSQSYSVAYISADVFEQNFRIGFEEFCQLGWIELIERRVLASQFVLILEQSSSF